MSHDVIEENRIGQRSEHVPRIWRVRCGEDIHENTWMKESECQLAAKSLEPYFVNVSSQSELVKGQGLIQEMGQGSFTCST